MQFLTVMLMQTRTASSQHLTFLEFGIGPCLSVVTPQKS